jgi:TetR/AcrR family transcriptional regulator, cholesterol catabolism regulator
MAVRKTKIVPKVITSGDLGFTGRDNKASAKLLEIVNAASELFHWKGYGATTTRDIGKACGISQGHLYYYIKSKEDIPGMFVAIQDHEVANWENEVRMGFGKLTPEELLRKAVRRYTELVHLRRKMVTFWYHAAIQVGPEQSAAIRQNEIRVIRVFQEILELGNKEGQFQASDPFLFACNIHMMCSTWALKRWHIKDSRSINQYADVVVELVSSMVRGNSE